MTGKPCTRCYGTGIEPDPGWGLCCEYVSCKQPAVGLLRADSRLRVSAALLCEEHVKPEAHPADLHELLVRW